MEAYGELVISGQHEPWKTQAQEILMGILLREFRTLYKKEKWVELLRFYDKQQLRLSFLPKKQEWMRLLADAYDRIGLSQQALKWYEAILQHPPPIEQHEEMLFQSIRIAHDVQDVTRTRELAEIYLKTYPKGTQSGEVSMILGRLDVDAKRYRESLEHFSNVLDRGRDKTKQDHAR